MKLFNLHRMLKSHLTRKIISRVVFFAIAGVVVTASIQVYQHYRAESRVITMQLEEILKYIW